MDGIHDLGGRQGFGRIRYGPNAPVYHQDWEKRVNALYSLAVRRGVFNMDEYRHMPLSAWNPGITLPQVITSDR
jgi:nitrile hydratase